MAGLNWDAEIDVLVLGSGGSALTAAILAHDEGAQTMVLEKAPVVGGTTAMSGGLTWIPGNHHQREAGFEDSRAEALTYMKAAAGDLGDVDLMEAFLDAAPSMIEHVERTTPVAFVTHEMFPDYHAELPGGRAAGRTLDPGLFEFPKLGEWENLVNEPMATTVPAMMVELGRGPIDPELIEQRASAGVRGGGNALIGGLLRGCLDRGLPIRVSTRAVELIRHDGAVVGVRAQQADGSDLLVRARRGVIMAVGGFEWDETLVRTFLRGPMTAPTSTPENEGDGLKMAMAVGASLGLMGEAWWMPSIEIPGATWRGRQASRMVGGGDRTFPGAIIVNGDGKRFANEAADYNTFGRALHEYRTESGNPGLRNLPCWIVFDQRRQDLYPLRRRSAGGEGGSHGGHKPGDGLPPEIVLSGQTLAELAGKMGVDADSLVATVHRFNGFVAAGKDTDFHRGEGAYGHFIGDSSKAAPYSTLGALEVGPFYAVELSSGTLGTKGGPKTNRNAQVLDLAGQPIPGLYAAGNTMASPAGVAYFGGGCTIGQGMTFGYIAGRTAAHDDIHPDH